MYIPQVWICYISLTVTIEKLDFLGIMQNRFLAFSISMAVCSNLIPYLNTVLFKYLGHPRG